VPFRPLHFPDQRTYEKTAQVETLYGVLDFFPRKSRMATVPYFRLAKYGIHTELNGNVAPNKSAKFTDGSFGIVEIAVVDC